MAFVSYGLNRGADQSPDKIAIGSDDGGAGNDVTLAFDLTKNMTTEDIVLILEAFKRRLLDSRLGPGDVVNI